MWVGSALSAIEICTAINTHRSICIHVHIDSYGKLVKWLSLYTYTYTQLRFVASFVWVGSTLCALEICTAINGVNPRVVGLMDEPAAE